MKKKMSSKTKKPRVDHEPVRAMAEPTHKIYHEGCQKPTHNERNKGLPNVNGTVVPEVAWSPPWTTVRKDLSQELLASVRCT